MFQRKRFEWILQTSIDLNEKQWVSKEEGEGKEAEEEGSRNETSLAVKGREERRERG